MSKVLTSFLVGIGYDTKGLEAGERKIAGSMQGIKGGALGISAALVGAFSVAAASVAATAGRVDQLAMATQNLRTSQNTVYNFGNALKLAGGNADSAVAALTRFEDIQNNLAIKGETPEINDLAMAGVDTRALYNTQTGEQFAQEIARQLPQLNEGQRAVVQDTLGLDDATMRLLSGGVAGLNEAMQKAQGLTGNVEQLNEDSRKLLESTAALGLTIEGIQNELANEFLPAMVGASQAVTAFAVSVGDFVSGRSAAGQSFSQSGPAGIAAMGAESIGADQGGAALRVTGALLDQTSNESFLDVAIPGYKQARGIYDFFFNSPEPVTSIEAGSGRVIRDDLTASDAMTAGDGAAMAEERRAQADALAGALSRSPVKVINELNVSLDGQALEAKITEVNERTAFDTINDVKSTTER